MSTIKIEGNTNDTNLILSSNSAKITDSATDSVAVFPTEILGQTFHSLIYSPIQGYFIRLKREFTLGGLVSTNIHLTPDGLDISFTETKPFLTQDSFVYEPIQKTLSRSETFPVNKYLISATSEGQYNARFGTRKFNSDFTEFTNTSYYLGLSKPEVLVTKGLMSLVGFTMDENTLVGSTTNIYTLTEQPLPVLTAGDYVWTEDGITKLTNLSTALVAGLGQGGTFAVGENFTATHEVIITSVPGMGFTKEKFYFMGLIKLASTVL